MKFFFWNIPFLTISGHCVQSDQDKDPKDEDICTCWGHSYLIFFDFIIRDLNK